MLSVIDINKKYLNNEFSAVERANNLLAEIKNNNDNAVIEVFGDVLENAKAVDDKRASGKAGKLAGTFMMIEDSIMMNGKKMTHGSKVLEDFVSPFTSTALQKLLDEDVIVLGRVNVNEFSYYSKNNVSSFGKVKNLFGEDLTVNSGVGTVVAKRLCDFAVGNDVCADVRKSGALNGVVSYRPTYGLVSRVGVSSLASSFDSFSFTLIDSADAGYLIDVAKGEDIKDMNSFVVKAENKKPAKKIAVIKNVNCEIYKKAVEMAEKTDFEIKEVELPSLDALLSVYQIMLSSECGSNLSRIDGIKFGKRSENCSDIEEVYRKTRTEFLGKPIKYLTMLGNYMLFTENVCEYYSKALDIRAQIRAGIDSILEDADAIILPLFVNTSDKTNGVNDYYDIDKKEVYNVLPEMLGLPVVSVPFEEDKVGTVQLISAKFNEENLFAVANVLKEF